MCDEQGDRFHQDIKTIKKALPEMVEQTNNGWLLLEYQKRLCYNGLWWYQCFYLQS